MTQPRKTTPDDARCYRAWNWVTGAPALPGPAPGQHSWRRALVRVSGLAAVGWFAYMDFTSPRPTAASGPDAPPVELSPRLIAVGWALAVLAAAVAGRKAMTWYQLRDHRRYVLDPVHLVLHKKLGYPKETRPDKYLHITPALAEEPQTGMRVMMPEDWDFADTKTREVFDGLLVKTGYVRGDVHCKPVGAGPYHFLQVTVQEKLIIQTLVTFSQVRGLVDECRPGRHLLALGAGDAHITGNLDGEAPHVGLSMRTGKGKSNVIKGIVAQEMHHGASCTILDYKRRSLKCFKGVEGVEYCRDVSEIHGALVRLAHEAMERNVLADELGDDEEPPWQRRLIVVEEQNSMLKRLRRWWEQNRTPDDPKSSPAVDAYEELLFMGRQVQYHIIASFQKLTVRAAGSTEARDQFGMIAMAGIKPSSWRMLADELPMPKVTGRPPDGRTWWVCNGEAPEGQAILWTDREAREWASTGKSSKMRVAGRGSRDIVSQGKQPARVAGRPVLQVVPNEDEGFVSLRDASSDQGRGTVPVTHQGLRRARHIDPEFPRPARQLGQTLLYAEDDLTRWERNREKSGGKTG